LLGGLAGGNPYRRKVPTFSAALDRSLNAQVVALGKVLLHRGDGFEGIALAKDVGALFVRADMRHQHVQLFEFRLVEAMRET
jgi:hypothetical protein